MLLDADDATQAVMRNVAEQKRWVLDLCNDVQELLGARPAERPEFLFVNLSQPKCSGPESIHWIRSVLPQPHITVLAALADGGLVLRSIIAGASGYLLKPLSARDLALWDSRRFENLFSPAALAALVGTLHQLTLADAPRPLSAREQEITNCLLAGQRDKEIADSLSLSVGTVHSHLINLFRKLKVHDRRAAVAKVKELLRPAEPGPRPK